MVNFCVSNLLFDFIQDVRDVDAFIEHQAQSNIGPTIQGKTFMDLGREQSERGNSLVLWEQAHQRVRSLPLLSKMILKLSVKWMSQATAILEVGSGKLKAEGRSYISSLMPVNISNRFTYSDLNCSASCGLANFMRADMVNLSRDVGKCSYDIIFGSCVLDTLHRRDLSKALKEVRASLKDGGRFIHISDLSFYLNALTDDFTKEGKLIFPFMDETYKGLQILSHQQLDSYLSSLSLSSEQNAFLRWYAELNPARRERLVSSLLDKLGELDFLTIGGYFSKWVGSLKIPGMEMVLNHVNFPKKLERSLEEAEFKILVYKKKERHCIISEQEGPCNHFSFSNEGYRARRIYVLAPGKSYYTLTVNLLIAEKSEKK